MNWCIPFLLLDLYVLVPVSPKQFWSATSRWFWFLDDRLHIWFVVEDYVGDTWLHKWVLGPCLLHAAHFNPISDNFKHLANKGMVIIFYNDKLPCKVFRFHWWAACGGGVFIFLLQKIHLSWWVTLTGDACSAAEARYLPMKNVPWYFWGHLVDSHGAFHSWQLTRGNGFIKFIHLIFWNPEVRDVWGAVFQHGVQVMRTLDVTSQFHISIRAVFDGPTYSIWHTFSIGFLWKIPCNFFETMDISVLGNWTVTHTMQSCHGRKGFVCQIWSNTGLKGASPLTHCGGGSHL